MDELIYVKFRKIYAHPVSVCDTKHGIDRQWTDIEPGSREAAGLLVYLQIPYKHQSNETDRIAM